MRRLECTLDAALGVHFRCAVTLQLLFSHNILPLFPFSHPRSLGAYVTPAS